MKIHNLKPAEGSRTKAVRKGRGTGSGIGRSAGRGHDGQKSRSGARTKPGFEGGQMPLIRRVPKRGFTNIFSKEIIGVNVEKLNRFDNDTEITPELLKKEGIIKKTGDGVKILGNGELDKKLVVRAHAFSKSAAEKIEAAGGKAEVI